MTREYVYHRTKNVASGLKIGIPSDAICVGIVSEFINGRLGGKKYVEWLQPV